MQARALLRRKGRCYDRSPNILTTERCLTIRSSRILLISCANLCVWTSVSPRDPQEARSWLEPQSLLAHLSSPTPMRRVCQRAPLPQTQSLGRPSTRHCRTRSFLRVTTTIFRPRALTHLSHTRRLHAIACTTTPVIRRTCRRRRLKTEDILQTPRGQMGSPLRIAPASIRPVGRQPHLLAPRLPAANAVSTRVLRARVTRRSWMDRSPPQSASSRRVAPRDEWVPDLWSRAVPRARRHSASCVRSTCWRRHPFRSHARRARC